MKNKTYVSYSDSGHGWLKISIKEVKALGIHAQISHYSYMRGDYAYLEEDCDVPLLFKALEAQNVLPLVKNFNTNKSSKIRSYNAYSASH